MLDCNETLNQPYPADGRLYCNATKDPYNQCWNYTLAGTTARGGCPKTHEAASVFIPEGYSLKVCNIDGTWWTHPESGKPWTNYIKCADLNILREEQAKQTEQIENNRVIIYVYISGYTLSTFLLVIAFCIFSIFRQLKCTRVTIHKHLFVSYVISAILMILFYTQVTLTESVIQDSPVWCHALFAFTQYFMLTNYAWMMSEGFYLHSIIVAAFSNQKKLMIASCLIGWVLPFIFIGVFVMVRICTEDTYKACWTDTHDSDTVWIFYTFVIISLMLNVIFLVNILRIIFSKVQSDPCRKNTRKYSKTLRACLILVPLLGIQFLLTPVTPEGNTFVYDVISAILASYQGAAIAVLFCFLNSEVLKLIERRISVFRDQSSIRKSLMSPYMINVTVEEDMANEGRRKSKNFNNQYQLVPTSDSAVKVMSNGKSDAYKDVVL